MEMSIFEFAHHVVRAEVFSVLSLKDDRDSAKSNNSP
jgi:hypothetical protein